jgi:small subunit ribosomal protein S9
MEVIHTVGRRKNSVARIYLNYHQNDDISIYIYKNRLNNNKEVAKSKNNNKYIKYNLYFNHSLFIKKLLKPFIITDTLNKYNVMIKVQGGGKTGQVDAIVLAISRALSQIDDNYKSVLKSKGLLTRDSRQVERKKFGQKKARKRFQFSKR